MKKLFLTLVLAVMGFTAAMADDATTLVATLNHGGALTAYYGKGALVDAYKAASNGDVITLSAGTFTATNIVKEVTVRGAGMLPEANTNNGMTVIDGDFKITLPVGTSQTKFEGLKLPSNITLSSNGGDGTKSQISFSKVSLTGGINADAKVFPQFNNCEIRYLSVHGCLCQNCYVYYTYAYKGGAESNTFQNCTLMMRHDGWYDYHTFENATLLNCLLIQNIDHETKLASDVKADYCVGFAAGYDPSYDFFSNIGSTTNRMVVDRESFFKESSFLKKSAENDYGQFSYEISGNNITPDNHGLFELTDEAAAQYTGNDGTVVGVWGGAHPFNLRPVGPWINKCEIVPRVGDDGKLNVTIEVAQ